MSLTDKAKEVAGKAVTEAKKGAAKVQGKVGDVQLRQKANGLAKEIGYLVVREKGGESVPDGEIDRLVGRGPVDRGADQGRQGRGSPATVGMKSIP